VQIWTTAREKGEQKKLYGIANAFGSSNGFMRKGKLYKGNYWNITSNMSTFLMRIEQQPQLKTRSNISTKMTAIMNFWVNTVSSVGRMMVGELVAAPTLSRPHTI
jgi:hypothetical protein